MKTGFFPDGVAIGNLKIFAASEWSAFPMESPSKFLSGVAKAYTANMCVELTAQPGHRAKQCRSPKEIIMNISSTTTPRC